MPSSLLATFILLLFVFYCELNIYKNHLHISIKVTTNYYLLSTIYYLPTTSKDRAYTPHTPVLLLSAALSVQVLYQTAPGYQIPYPHERHT